MPFDPSILEQQPQQPDLSQGGLPGIDVNSIPQQPQAPQGGFPGIDLNIPPAGAPPSNGAPPPQQPPQQQAMPTSGFGGKLKDMLQRFAYFGGQAALKHVGLPTDDELQMHNAQIANTQSEIALRNQQILAAKQNAQLVPYLDENGMPKSDAFGNIQMIPRAVMNGIQKTYEANKGKAQAATITGQFGLQKADITGQYGVAKAEAAATGRAPTKIALTLKALQGDPEAKKALDFMHQQDLDLMKARGMAFGQGRLWTLQRAMDPDTGESGFYTGFNILQAKQAGKNLIPMGSLSGKDLISVQQLQSEAVPAIQGVEKNVGAFDNANDRAIFARVLKGAGSPQRGAESSWMGNVLNQALKEGLSDQGQQLAINELRLAETMGRLRATIGLPATDQAMAISLALLPGASTPNSKFAKDQIEQLRGMVGQATGIPLLRGATKSMGIPQAPSGMVTAVLPNGTRGQIPAVNKDKFLKDNPGAKIQ